MDRATHNHNEDNVFRRQCAYCSIIWSAFTSIGSIAKHLLHKHNVNSTTQPQASRSSALIQTSVDTSKIAISRTLERKYDISIARYIVSELLPHVHVKSLGLKRLIHVFSPGYQLKSARTLKRLVLRMYVVFRQLAIDYLSSENFQYAITYDGWSNNRLKGFYPMTLHWVDLESGKPISLLLDFLDVFPGDGVGKCVGHAFEIIWFLLTSYIHNIRWC